MCVPSGTNYLNNVNRASYDAPAFGLGKLSQDTYAIRGKIAYKLSDAATLTYTGGYRHFEGEPGQVTTLPFNFRNFSWDQRVDTQSHELRLNGEINGVIYQVGGFYFKEQINAESAFVTTFGPNVVQLTYFKRRVDTDSKSAFGQVEIPLGSDKLTFIGGLRYTDNGRSSLPYGSASPFGAGPPDSQLFNGTITQKNFSTLLYRTVPNLKVSESKVTWLANLNYKPDPDTLIYAKVSTGFKGGGFDAKGNYKPETNTAIEAGLKKNFGDHGQHLFNLSAFHYDYKDLQVSVLLDPAIGGQIFNAGKAKIWGVEASTVISLSDNDRFNASFNYLHAEYKELLSTPNVFCFDINATDTKTCDNTPIPNFNYAGYKPPYSPSFVITAGYEHVFQLGSAGTLTAGVNTLFKSEYFTAFFNYNDSRQKAYSQTDLNLTYKPENGKFTVQAFARNLEDNRPLVYSDFIAAGPTTRVMNWQFGTPRTYGVRVGVDF
jgi:iron complex outermembrane receptor protein